MIPPFKITKVLVLITNFTDKVMLFTDLPPAVFPYKENTTLQFEVAKGKGVEYVRENFGLEAPTSSDERPGSTVIEYEIKDVSA